MKEIVALFLIGLALSTDAFSLALAVGTTRIEKDKKLILALLVGILHFSLPLLGILIGATLTYMLSIGTSFLMAVILILIASQMVYNVIVGAKKQFKMTYWGMIVFGFAVSFDSFSVGLGLHFIVTQMFLAGFIFAVISFTFTLVGFNIGNFVGERFGDLAIVIGAIILVGVAIITLV